MMNTLDPGWERFIRYTDMVTPKVTPIGWNMQQSVKNTQHLSNEQMLVCWLVFGIVAVTAIVVYTLYTLHHKHHS